MVISDIAGVVMMLAGVLMIYSGMESIAERLVPLLLAVVIGGMGSRIIAALRAATDPNIPSRARFDTACRYLFFPGWAASRYLRNSG